MELMEVLKKRRAVREYDDAHLQAATIERLITAATLAPSAMNEQPWAFAALLDRKRIEGYGERAKWWLLENPRVAGLNERLREMLSAPCYALFYNAPAMVLVLSKSAAHQAIEDCCLAAENLMLAARDEGIGSCWIGLARPWLNLPETKKELRLPKGCEIVAPIILGHPKEWPEPHGRNPAEIHWLA